MSCHWGIWENSVAHLFLVSLKALGYDCFCQLAFLVITPLSHFFSVFFWVSFCFSRCKECSLLVYSAHCLPYSISTLDHFQHFIKNSFAFLPFMGLAFPSPAWTVTLSPDCSYAECQHYCSCSLQASDSVTMTDRPFMPVQPSSAPYFASRTQLSSAFSIWAMPTHLTAFIFLSAKYLASFLAEMCHKKSTLSPPWWWKSSCKTYC